MPQEIPTRVLHSDDKGTVFADIDQSGHMFYEDQRFDESVVMNADILRELYKMLKEYYGE